MTDTLLQSRQFKSKLAATPVYDGPPPNSKSDNETLLATCWWDRRHGEGLQKANSKGARTKILNEARRELASLERWAEMRKNAEA